MTGYYTAIRRCILTQNPPGSFYVPDAKKTPTNWLILNLIWMHRWFDKLSKSLNLPKFTGVISLCLDGPNTQIWKLVVNSPNLSTSTPRMSWIIIFAMLGRPEQWSVAIPLDEWVAARADWICMTSQKSRQTSPYARRWSKQVTTQRALTDAQNNLSLWLSDFCT